MNNIKQKENLSIISFKKNKSVFSNFINTNKYLFNPKLGFTLVELIVVISILSILGTIAFVSFGSYSSQARDSSRISDIANLNKGLELYQVKSGTYPMPEGNILTGVVDGADITYKGVIGDNIARMINFSKTPTDPLDNTTKYIYGLTFDKSQYQIASILENVSTLAYDYKLINSVNALELGGSTAVINNSIEQKSKVGGNYKGFIKFSTGSTYYLSNIPSLIYNYSDIVSDMINDKGNVFFSINNKANLPYGIGNIQQINNTDTTTLIKNIKGDDQSDLIAIDITNIINATDSSERETKITETFGTGSEESIINCYNNVLLNSKILLNNFGIKGNETELVKSISNMIGK